MPIYVHFQNVSRPWFSFLKFTDFRGYRGAVGTLCSCFCYILDRGQPDRAQEQCSALAATLVLSATLGDVGERGWARAWAWQGMRDEVSCSSFKHTQGPWTARAHGQQLKQQLWSAGAEICCSASRTTFLWRLALSALSLAAISRGNTEEKTTWKELKRRNIEILALLRYITAH